jgi:glycosyltransferase involved in cell wall biosynthesis
MSTRDGAKTIDKTLDSLFAQTVKPCEVIVLDDGSTDGTSEILKSYGVKLIREETKDRDYRRLPLNFNKCLKSVNRVCGYHLILGDDVIIPENYMRNLMDRMNSSHCVIASGSIHNREDWKTPVGAGRVVNEHFFRSYVKEYPYRAGWESWLIWKAWMHGFETRCYSDLKIMHQRQLGSYHNYQTFAAGMKALGYHPLLVYLRVTKSLILGSPISRQGALSMMLSYRRIKMGTTEYYSYYDDSLQHFIKTHQKKRIKEKLLLR